MQDWFNTVARSFLQNFWTADWPRPSVPNKSATLPAEGLVDEFPTHIKMTPRVRL